MKLLENMKISIISPVYKAEKIIEELVEQIEIAFSGITANYEILLIEDHSPDNSWDVIRKLAKENKKIKGIKLSRNFGQHKAIEAGMETCSGDYVIVMDCDLQHNPKYIIDLVNKIQEGYDLVLTKTKQRKHNFIKNFTAKIFYKFLRFIGNHNMDESISNYSILSKKVVEAYNKYNDYNKAYLWVLNWIGFDSAIIEIEHSNRSSGKSSYSFKNLIKLALNIAVSNSERLLYMTFYIGLITSILSFLGIITIMIRYFFYNSLMGWSSLIVFIMFFSGMILTSIGVVAVYLGKTYEQTKNRPRYLISKKINLHD
jgi:dolichol-phosphate mannosyltransferase